MCHAMNKLHVDVHKCKCSFQMILPYITRNQDNRMIRIVYFRSVVMVYKARLNGTQINGAANCSSLLRPLVIANLSILPPIALVSNC